jgi:superfamily II DNA/RNA helicase
MTHHVFHVARENKPAVVRELVSGQGRTLAFTRTKHGAKKLAKQLTASGIPAVDLHGNLSQSARQRNLAAFSDGSTRVLVATDIAARGIHVDEVTLVVHVDPPAEHKAYLHRSGRTARAGAEGVVVTVSTPEERGDTRSLMRQAGITPKASDVTPGHPLIGQLTGPAAELVTPAPAAAPQQQHQARRASGQAKGRGGQTQTRGGQPKAPGGQQTRGGQPKSRDGQPKTRSGHPQSRGGRPQAAARTGGGLAGFSAGRRGR